MDSRESVSDDATQAYKYYLAKFKGCLSVYTSLVPRPMTMVFGLGMRPHLHMCMKLENGVLSNGQQLQSAVNRFINPDEYEAIMTLCGHERYTHTH